MTDKTLNEAYLSMFELEKEKAELLEALKDAKSEIEWAAGCTFDSPIASKLKAAASKMVKAIENAEKK